MERQAPRQRIADAHLVKQQVAALAFVLGLLAPGFGQNLPDKSAPNERNTDLQFDFSVTNNGKLGTYRIVRLDTGETLATGLVGKDVSPRTTLLNEFKAAGLPARTPVIIQVQGADGTWSTVDSIEVHYPPEPSDSQRYLDDAGYRGNFRVPDLDAPKPTPTPTPSPTPTASPAATPSARDLPSDRASDSSGRAQKDNPKPASSSTPDNRRNSTRYPHRSGS
jgi:hypothetical protein